MAVSMDALLKLRAAVEGTGAVTAMGNAIGGVKKAAEGTSGALQKMTQSAGLGGLAGAMGALTPLLSVAGLVGMAKAALDNAGALDDMSEKTGVSVEMLAKFKKAAALGGSSIETVQAALLRLSKAMTAAASNTDLSRMTKDEIERATGYIREGERRQTEEIKRQADQRVSVLEEETDKRLKEISKRYRREEQLLSDHYDDQADAAANARDDQMEAELSALDDQFEARKKALRDNQALTDEQREAELKALEQAQRKAVDIVRDRYAAEAKEMQRSMRDARQEQMDKLQEQQAAEEEVIRKGANAKKQVIQTSTNEQIEVLKKFSEQSIKSLQPPDEISEFDKQLEDLGLSGKGASELFAQMGIKIKDSAGQLRDPGQILLEIADYAKNTAGGAEKAAAAMKLLGKGGAELVPMLNMGKNSILDLKVAMTGDTAAAVDIYEKKLVNLQGKFGLIGLELGQTLLPLLSQLADVLLSAANAFQALDPGLQKIIGSVTLLAIGWAALAPAIGAVASGIGVVVGLITAALAPAIMSLLALLAGWAPVIVGIFTGPVGWIALLIAAGAAIYVFRDQIADALAQVGRFWGDAFQFITDTVGGFFSWLGEALYTLYLEPWVKIGQLLLEVLTRAWEAVKEPITGFFTWYAKTAYQLFIEPIVKVATDMVTILRTAWQELVQLFNTALITPLTRAWSNFINGFQIAWTAAGNWIQSAWNGIATLFRDVVVGPVTAAWNGLVQTVRNALNSVVQAVGNAVNITIGIVRNLIDGLNVVRAAGGLSAIAKPNFVAIPQFAKGGYVTGPTLGLVGEAGSEYIIPASRMGDAAANYMAGARGAAVLSSGGGSGGPVTVSITTGPVVQFDGANYVSMADFQRGIDSAVQQSVRVMSGALRSDPGLRRQVGI